MFYLISAIVSSAMVSICMRISEKYIHYNLSLLTVNYIMCAVFAAALAGPGHLFVRYDGTGVAVGLGLIAGILYLAGFILLQWNIGINGVTFSATYMKLGVLVPTATSILLFHEIPDLFQLIGFLGALAAIILIGSDSSTTRPKNHFALILLLLGGGFCDVTSKFYSQFGNPALSNHFLFYSFLSALVFCLILTVSKHQKAGKNEVFFGVIISAPNFFSFRFLLKAVDSLPAVVAYPTYSVGTIIAVSLVGFLVFREKISRRWIVSMLLILISIGLLNL